MQKRDINVLAIAGIVGLAAGTVLFSPVSVSANTGSHDDGESSHTTSSTTYQSDKTKEEDKTESNKEDSSDDRRGASDDEEAKDDKEGEVVKEEKVDAKVESTNTVTPAPTPTPAPAPAPATESIPETGPGAIMGILAGTAALGYTTAIYMRSRKSLRDIVKK